MYPKQLVRRHHAEKFKDGAKVLDRYWYRPTSTRGNFSMAKDSGWYFMENVLLRTNQFNISKFYCTVVVLVV